jgi:hypothetical protein
VSNALRRCTNCNTDLPVSQFYRRHDTRTLGSWCKRCTNNLRKIRTIQRKLRRGERDEWDWAVALSKHTKVSASRQDHRYNETAVDAEMLRSLMELQGGRCALSGIKLVYPEVISVKGFGLQKWQKSLSKSDYGKSVALIRLDTNRPWELGNVMLVTQMFADLYGCVDNINELKQYCGDVCNMRTVIYDADAIAMKRSERRQARLTAYANKQEIPW